MQLIKKDVYPSPEGNVWKYVYEFENAIVEAVLYKYESFEKRTVICFSVQSGCRVACRFCGTGSKFIRNLTSEEIIYQVSDIIRDVEYIGNINTSLNSRCEKLQLMGMSMGEPLMNFDEVEVAIKGLNNLYPNASLLLSTIGVNNNNVLNRLCELSEEIDKVGLQFSIHQAYDEKRNELIPFKNKLTLREIRDYGTYWNSITNRPVYLNYCIDGTNISDGEINRLKDLFPPTVFNFTFSVICSADETMKDAGYRNLDVINEVMTNFIDDGYNVRVFDPAGQDSVGAGCGQLVHVQRYMKNHKK